MIDLTKPIRRKEDGKLASLHFSCFVMCGGGGGRVDLAELERDYENAPEPKVLHEWLAFRLEGGGLATVIRHGDKATVVRVIEWPADAEPELPT